MTNQPIIPKKIEDYVEEHTSKLNNNLLEIERSTYLNVLQPHMLSGNYQGQLLRMLSIMKQPKRILEIGTFTGYSALCLAEGLDPNGELHTIDVNAELMEKTKQHFENSPYSKQIHLHIGNAGDIIEQLPTPFDIVFIDADKENYWNYFELVVDKMSPKGLIIADNVLWKGKVVNEPKDKKTRLLDQFNQLVNEDDRVDNILLPIRDGLMLIMMK